MATLVSFSTVAIFVPQLRQEPRKPFLVIVIEQFLRIVKDQQGNAAPLRQNVLPESEEEPHEAGAQRRGIGNMLCRRASFLKADPNI